MNILVLDDDKYRRYYFGEDVDRIIVDNGTHTPKNRRVWGFRDNKQVFADLMGEDPPVLLG